MPLTVAERLLQELGITDPEEIDLEAIAYHVRAEVRYRSLVGCEARIVGCNARAIISVKANSNPERKRFSIAHELGHWHHHRGRCLACRAEDYRPRDVLSPERVADAYAADLLMPRYLFDPIVQQHKKLTFKVVSTLAETFRVSLTAMAIRLVESDHTLSLLVCHGSKGRKWFTRAPSVPQRWFPKDDLDSEGFAFGVLFGRAGNDTTPRLIGADAWFDRSEANRYDVHEQTVRTGPDEVLSLILINDGRMIEERESSIVSRYM